MRKPAISLRDFDRTVRPADDFYRFVTGGWAKRTAIPANESIWGSFYELRRENRMRVNVLLERLAHRTPRAPEERKLRDYYRTAMDAAKLNRDGARPLAPELARIEALTGKADLPALVAHLHRLGAHPFFVPFVDQDEKHSDRYVLYIQQSGLGMPDRDYYLKKDKKSRTVQRKYRAHIEKMFRLLGVSTPRAKRAARTVLRLENMLAEDSLSRVKLRDVIAQYNKMNVRSLARLTPAFDWPAYFKAAGTPKTKEVIVRQPTFAKSLNHLLRTTSLNDLKIYLTWHLAIASAPYLSDAFVKQSFSFYGKVLAGAKQLKPRWLRAVLEIDSALGEAAGKLYVQEHFPPSAKRKMDRLIDHLFRAYAERIRALDWMGAATKRKALVKLRAMRRKIGYPERWRSYATLAVTRDSYLKNHFAAEAFDFDRNIRKLGRPIDRTEWFMTPPTVNAYCSHNMNEIAFPAGILQHPFFGPDLPDAVNYGAIGSVIGHELTHGFDDQGRLYDKTGSLKSWWGSADKKRFEKKAARLVKQYDAYEIIDGMHCNGKLTLGENIADLGGLIIAYKAFKQALRGAKRQAQSGFTPEQLFFIGYTITEKSKIRPALQRQFLRTDPHAPSKLRVNAVVSNMPEFYEAFGVGPGDKLYRSPAERVVIW